VRALWAGVMRALARSVRAVNEADGVRVGTMRTVRAFVWAASLRSGAADIRCERRGAHIVFSSRLSEAKPG
jgi:hypothetical protein